MDDVCTNPSASKAPKIIPWTPINHPWRRNSHNAALFDRPPGPHVTQHALPSMDVYDEDPKEDEDEVDALGEEEFDEPAEEATPPTAQQTSSAPTSLTTPTDITALLIADPTTLPPTAFLTLASQYTNAEILALYQQHHPTATLPPRIRRFAQTLSYAITQVASQRGVGREVVKAELDEMREGSGVAGRMKAEGRERRRKREGSWVGDEGAEAGPVLDGGMGMEVGAVQEVGGEGVEARRTVSPYGLGSREVVAQERVIADSEDDEEEL